MKILTGRFKGKSVPFSPTPGVRPTADKLRKAVFDVLKDFVAGKRVLDLFSGTGAMGLEALSQEAAFVHFVEHDRSQARAIEKTLKDWGLEDVSQVSAADVLRIVPQLAASGEAFDLVFVDPPYQQALGAATLSALDRGGIVRAGGFVVLEAEKREDLPGMSGAFKAVRDKKYGQSRLVIYRKEKAAD